MSEKLRAMIKELEDLRGEMQALVVEQADLLAAVCEENRVSARNLLHYLAMRRREMRGLQERLADLGLSSLGRTETHVLKGLEAVLAVLLRLDGREAMVPAGECDRMVGGGLLKRNTGELLGMTPEGRRVRIMVTMPTEAATDYALVHDFLQHGMDCMRINCAHDEDVVWLGMIQNLRMAERETGRSCKVLMDLAGPKLRTGPVELGPGVVKMQPKRDEMGVVMKAARVWLTPVGKPELPKGIADACLPVPLRWLKSLGVGDKVKFVDARGARRTIRVSEVVGRSRWADSFETAYVTAGMELTAVYRDGLKEKLVGKVGPIDGEARALVLRVGEELVLTRGLEPGREGRIGVTLPELFDCVEEGQPIWFDDGKIGGLIRTVGVDEVIVEIMQAKPEGSKLAAEKGINLPETQLKTAALSEDDLSALEFVKQHADLVGYSFLRDVEDVRLMELKLGDSKLGVVLKIETREGFENLPVLMLEAMRRRNVGVMIARGDLAIECGFERMAEVQEQILWIAEAAHVPVIWATQVLETLAKTGRPSRAEITDAAMGERAECVMLNKGPHVLEAVRTLDDILRRMGAHNAKKMPIMRRLGVAADFGAVKDIEE